ncbi:MAG: methylornithine synthase PylB [Oscillospiraceae bacterium]
MIKTIIDQCLERQWITDNDIKALLLCDDPDERELIFRAAREQRSRIFGNKVFLYGFVYFSTFCKNDCAFCLYRASGSGAVRYRKTADEIIKTAVELKNSGVHLIDLTMGEDGFFTGERLSELVSAVKEATGLPVMISPGLADDETIERLAQAGADWFALYQETHNETLFDKVRIGQSYDARMHAKEYAAQCGMLIEEGLLTGIGDSADDTVRSFGAMRELGAAQVRTMTFIPQKGTPMAHLAQGSFDREIMNIAVMRLIFPYALIPASLDVDGLDGLEHRLNAGANVVTSIIPPRKGFAGVANASHDIDDGKRTVAGIQDVLRSCALVNATAQEYSEALDAIRQNSMAFSRQA